MEEPSFYVRELAYIPELQEKFSVLDIKSTELIFEWLQTRFNLPWGQIDWSRVSNSKSVEVKSWTCSQIGDYILSVQPPSKNDNWIVIWSDSDVAITLHLSLICRFIGELWYPGKSDVWMISPNKNFCIELTHESVLSYSLLS